MLGNIKHQLTLVITGGNPTSRAVGTLAVCEAIERAGLHLATNLSPQTSNAIEGWKTAPEDRKPENPSMVVSIMEASPMAEAMLQQAIPPQSGFWHPVMGGGFDPRFGAGAMPQPGMGMQPPPYRAYPYGMSPHPVFAPNRVMAGNVRVFNSNWPLNPPPGMQTGTCVTSTALTDSNGLHYQYAIHSAYSPDEKESTIQEIKFGQGESGENGVRTADLLVICADRLQCAQRSPTATPAKAEALKAVLDALNILHNDTGDEFMKAKESREDRWK